MANNIRKVMQERHAMEWLAGGSETEEIISAGVLVLAIVGLSCLL